MSRVDNYSWKRNSYCEGRAPRSTAITLRRRQDKSKEGGEWVGEVERGRNEAKRGGEGARQSSFSGVSFLLSVVGGPLSQHAYKAVFIGNVAAHGPEGRVEQIFILRSLKSKHDRPPLLLPPRPHRRHLRFIPSPALEITTILFTRCFHYYEVKC